MKFAIKSASIYAATLGCLLFPVAAFSATTDELERRLQKLEEEVKIANDEVADLAERNKNAMTVGGYADIEYVGTNESDATAGFRLHHLSLMFKKQLSEDLKFFSEIELEDGVWMDAGDGSNALLLEALNFDYAVNHSTTARVGRFFTPAGIWSVDHYPPFVATQERPLHIRQIFPQLTDGAAITGNHALGNAFVNYNFYAGNGETKNFDGKKDSNYNTAAGLRVNASLPIAKVFDVGATLYHEKMKDDTSLTNPEPKKKAYGVHAKVKQGSFGFQGEYANGTYTPTLGANVGISYHKKGYYGQFSYDIAKWTLGYRHDFFDPDSTAALDNTKVNSLIVNYHVDKNTVLKWEHHLFNLEDPVGKDYYRSIVSIAVNFN